MASDTPRVVYRDPATHGKVRYHLLGLDALRWQASHIAEYFVFGEKRKRRVREPDLVTIPGAGTFRRVLPQQLSEFVRRPTAKALRRIDDAERALAAAEAELLAAKRAAFTYGRPVPISTVKQVTRHRRRASSGS